MFQRVLLDFVLKTFGLGAENETRTRASVGIFLANYIFASTLGFRTANYFYTPSPWKGGGRGVASGESSCQTKKAARLDCFS